MGIIRVEKYTNPRRESSYMVYTEGSLVKALNGTTGIIDILPSTDAGVVMLTALNAGGNISVRDGTYNFSSFVLTNVLATCGIIGETMDGVIFDFAGMPTGVDNVPNNQYAGMVLVSSGAIHLENITFKNYSKPCVGLGQSVGAGVSAQNAIIKNLRFSNCTHYGVAIFDGQGSVVENIHGDNPFNIVSFWYGTESNIVLRDILMKPTLGSYSIAPDDAISFNPAVDVVCDNIVIENVVGDYSIYFASGGTENAIGGVIDLAGFGGHSFKHVKVNHVIGNRACALYAGGYSCVGITDSEFKDIHSTYAFTSGSTGAGVQRGITFPLASTSGNVVIANIIFDGIYIDHAYGTGFSFTIESVAPNTCSTNGVTFKNLYLTDNNQCGGTTIYLGCAGLDIGNNGSVLSTFDGVTIENAFAIDDQVSPTQQRPCVLWNYGTSGTTLTNVTVAFGEFKGNAYNVIGKTYNRTFPDPTIRDVDGYVNKNTGSATMGSGQTIVDVSGGLVSGIYDLNKITIQPQDNISGRNLWASATSGNTFRVNLNLADAQPHVFGWIISD